MNTDTSFLEIRIHPSNGGIQRFPQYDPQAIQQTLDRIQPERLFAQREIILATDYSQTVYPASAIARLDLVMDGFPAWPFHRNVADIIEITQSEFARGFASHLPRVEADGTTRVFSEMELTNGQRLFREVRLKPSRANTEAEQETLPDDQALFLHQLLSRHGLWCRLRGGGAVLINPAHLVRMTFYRGPGTIPPNAWRVQGAMDHSYSALAGV